MKRQTWMMTVAICLAGTSPALAQKAPGAQELPVASAAAPAEAFDARLGPEVLQARPPRSGARATGELLAGMAGGGLASAGGFLLGMFTAVGLLSQKEPCEDCDDAGAELAAVIGGGYLGAVALYPLGTGLGVALAGTAGDQTGSFGVAIGGSYLGALTGVAAGAAFGYLATRFIDPERAGEFAVFGGTAGFLVGAPIGAFIGFDRTRAYDVSPVRPPLAGLVSVDEDRTHLSVPVISMTPDPLHPGHVVTSVRVIDARF